MSVNGVEVDDWIGSDRARRYEEMVKPAMLGVMAWGARWRREPNSAAGSGRQRERAREMERGGEGGGEIKRGCFGYRVIELLWGRHFRRGKIQRRWPRQACGCVDLDGAIVK
jgi:hypothetical protein